MYIPQHKISEQIAQAIRMYLWTKAEIRRAAREGWPTSKEYYEAQAESYRRVIEYFAGLICSFRDSKQFFRDFVAVHKSAVRRGFSEYRTDMAILTMIENYEPEPEKVKTRRKMIKQRAEINRMRQLDKAADAVKAAEESREKVRAALKSWRTITA